MKIAYFSITALLAAITSAQDGLPTCAQGCVGQFTSGSQIGGCNNLDIACICASPTFLSGIACCLAGACDATDQASAVAYAQNICKTAGVTVPDAVSCSSGSATATATGAASSTAKASTTGTQASSSASSTATSNAGNVAGVGGAGLFGLAAAVAML